MQKNMTGLGLHKNMATKEWAEMRGVAQMSCRLLMFVVSKRYTYCSSNSNSSNCSATLGTTMTKPSWPRPMLPQIHAMEQKPIEARATPRCTKRRHYIQMETAARHTCASLRSSDNSNSGLVAAATTVSSKQPNKLCCLLKYLIFRI